VHVATTGAPILDCALAWLDCEVRHVLALGSHSWFVGELVDCGESLGDSPAPDADVLRMEDTRMNYGG
jgi:flavin reductase (DIM6/NTAB) family NADH-FMN oxidoreductase RutF